MLTAVALALAGCSGGADDAAGAAGSSEAPEGVELGSNEAGGETLSRGEPVSGGSLRTSSIAPVESLDPAGPVSSGAEMMRAIFDVLMALDEEGNPVPELAESMETEDDGATWTMTLPEGVSFTDGTPFDAAAVVAHVERLAAEGSRSRSAGDMRQIASMDTPDEHTVVFTLAEPSMVFPKVFTYMGSPGGPSMVPSPASVAEWGDEVASHPVGVGPFKLKSFQPGGDVVLERNPDYRVEGLPYLDELTFVNATDTQARLSAAIAGDLDYASTQSATDLRRAEEAGLVVLEQPAFTFYNFLFNLSRPPFDDVRFRQAVMHGVDLDGVNQATFDGLHPVMTGMVPADNPFYVDTDWPSYDPDAARALVEEYTADTGVAPEFRLTTTSPPEFQQQAAVIQQMLADVGITMHIDVGDQPTMVTEALAGNYDAQHRFVAVYPEVENSFRTNFHSTSAANNGQVGDPELDALLDEARMATTPEERRELNAQMQHRLAEWLPMMPLIQHVTGYYVGDTVGGFPGSRPGLTHGDDRYLWAVQE